MRNNFEALMTRSVYLCFLAAAGMLWILAPALAQPTQYHAWWNDPTPGSPAAVSPSHGLPRLHVAGNRIVDEKGVPFTAHGIAVSDPDKIEHQGHWSRDLFVRLKALGANIVRIPVHPAAWRERTPAGYLTLLDSAVTWSTEVGMYLMIDWHSIGNLSMELFQDPMYNTTKTETYGFWRTIARHFKDSTTPAFYELFNEPTLFRGELGSMPWSEWKHINENIIRLIRAHDEAKIPLVAGLDWAYDLTPLADDPLDLEGVVYVTHPYPHKRTPPYELKWEENFGFAARSFPVIATEFGFTLGDEGLAANGEYGRSIISYLEKKGIGWICWVYDPEWGPRMITSWKTHELTPSGAFFRDALRAAAARDGKRP
jgi:endoglucanase